MNPVFKTVIKIPYYFEKKQKITFKVYDADITQGDAVWGDPLGKIKTTVGNLFGARD